MSEEKKADYLEQGFSKLVEKQLEKYFASHSKGSIPPGLYERIINEVEKIVINVTLKHVDGNQLQASKILGINRNTLRKKILKYAGEDR